MSIRDSVQAAFHLCHYGGISLARAEAVAHQYLEPGHAISFVALLRVRFDTDQPDARQHFLPSEVADLLEQAHFQRPTLTIGPV